MELTITYTIEVTEVIKDEATIAAITADGVENITAIQEKNLRDSFYDVADVKVRDVKLFLREDDE